MPVFENRVALELARGIRVFLKVEAGVTRDGAAQPLAGPGAPKATGRAQARRLEQAGRRIASKGRAALGIKARRRQLGGGEAQGAGTQGARPEGIRPENIIWIFGAGRTGSTWLSRMMGELKGYSVWFEPWLGAMFDPYHLRLGKRKGRSFVLAPQYRKTWLGSIRSFVLDGAEARFPEAGGEEGYLVIKEPGGSAGAPLLMEALPESRMILLVRDPRDYAASWLDAHKEGGWKSDDNELDDVDSEEKVVGLAKRYLRNVGGAKQAYDAHEGRKVLVRYEELRADALGVMKRIYSTLGMPADEGKLAKAVEEHSWENIPEEEKGEGKFYRKATPGSWRQDLTPEQAEMVEKITAPLLNELYPSR